jgi:hypothetical protein
LNRVREPVEALLGELLEPPEPARAFELCGWAGGPLDPVGPSGMAALPEVLDVVLLVLFAVALVEACDIRLLEVFGGVAPVEAPHIVLLELFGLALASVFGTALVKPPYRLAPRGEPDNLVGASAGSEAASDKPIDGVRPESAEPAGAKSVGDDEYRGCAGAAKIERLGVGALARVLPLGGVASLLVLPSSTPVAPPSTANVSWEGLGKPPVGAVPLGVRLAGSAVPV